MNKLPDNWTTAPIGSICELINGRAFKPTDWTKQGLPIVRIQNLNNPNAPFNYYDGQVRDRFLIEKGALLFAWSGTPGTSFGAHVWTGGRAVLNQHIFNVIFDKRHIDRDFFKCAINQKLDELISKAHGGVGLRHVTKGKFEETEIVLPPFREQRRIVGKLNRLLMRSHRARKELARIPLLIDHYKRAILAAAFRGELTSEWREQNSHEAAVVFAAAPTRRGRRRSKAPLDHATFVAPYELPDQWKWLPLPALGQLDRGKSRHRPRNDERLFGGPYPFIQTGEVRACDGTLTTYERTYSEFGLAQSRLWPVGTVCITIAANIAETAILGIEACFPDSVVGFIANDALCSNQYIEYFLRTAREELEAFAPATAQKNINLDTLAQVFVPMPPRREQDAIVAKVHRLHENMRRIAAESASARALLDRLDQATLSKAFLGELVPQDPEDEPASVLLERIRAARSPGSRRTAGSNRGRFKPKEPKDTARKKVMGRKRSEVERDYLHRTLVKLGGSARAKQLWQRSEMDIDEFYKQLRQEVKAGHISEGAKKDELVAVDAP